MAHPRRPPKVFHLVRIRTCGKTFDHLTRFSALFGTRSSFSKDRVPALAHKTHFLVPDFSSLKILTICDGPLPGSLAAQVNRVRKSPGPMEKMRALPAFGRPGAPPLRSGLPSGEHASDGIGEVSAGVAEHPESRETRQRHRQQSRRQRSRRQHRLLTGDSRPVACLDHALEDARSSSSGSGGRSAQRPESRARGSHEALQAGAGSGAARIRA